MAAVGSLPSPPVEPLLTASLIASVLVSIHSNSDSPGLSLLSTFQIYARFRGFTALSASSLSSEKRGVWRRYILNPRHRDVPLALRPPPSQAPAYPPAILARSWIPLAGDGVRNFSADLMAGNFWPDVDLLPIDLSLFCRRDHYA